MNVGGNLLMAATGNLNLTGTQLSIGTCGTGAVKLLVGGSMNIAAVLVEAKSGFLSNPNTKNWDKQIHESQTVAGSV